MQVILNIFKVTCSLLWICIFSTSWDLSKGYNFLMILLCITYCYQWGFCLYSVSLEMSSPLKPVLIMVIRPKAFMIYCKLKVCVCYNQNRKKLELFVRGHRFSSISSLQCPFPLLQTSHLLLYNLKQYQLFLTIWQVSTSLVAPSFSLIPGF